MRENSACCPLCAACGIFEPRTRIQLPLPARERFVKPSAKAGPTFLLSALLASALSGCTALGPDYEEPRIEWLQHWDTRLHGLVGETEQGSEADLRFWWRLFGDPALDKLVAEVDRSNHELRIAALRILESRAVQGIAAGGRYPQLHRLDGSLDYNRSRGDDGTVQDGQTTTTLGYSIVWEPDFWGRYRRAVEAADAGFFAAVENRRALEVLLHARVVELYYSWRVDAARMAIARENARIQKRSLDIARENFQAGNTSELDLQQARTQYLATRAVLPELQARQTRTRNALCVLLGRPPGPIPELEQATAELPRIDGLQVAAVPANLLLRRPDVRAAAWGVAAQSARIGIAEADLYPSLSLAGALGWAASSNPSLSATTLSVGPALRWNLFSFGRLENAVRVQDARLEQRIEAYRNSVLKAAAEVDNAAIEVLRSGEQLSVLEQTVQSAERAVRIARVRYQEGYADFQRVLDAQRSLYTQADRLVTTHGRNLAAVVALYKALGGGWTGANLDDMLPEEIRETMKKRTDWGGLVDAPLTVPPGPREAAAAQPGNTNP